MAVFSGKVREPDIDALWLFAVFCPDQLVVFDRVPDILKHLAGVLQQFIGKDDTGLPEPLDLPGNR